MSATDKLSDQFGSYGLVRERRGEIQPRRGSSLYTLFHGDLPEPGVRGHVVGMMGIIARPHASLVQFLHTAQAHKHMAPLMLAIGHNEAMAHTGHSLMPSPNLSPHSMRLVQGAAARGLIHQDMVPTEVSNDITWLEPEMGQRRREHSDVVS